MPLGTIAGWVAAGGSLITAVGSFLLALSAFRTRRTVEVVHKIVNQERTERVRYTHILIRALEVAGIEIPEDQSKLD